MRTKKPGPSATNDPAIAALLADIDASIADFEDRLREAQALEGLAPAASPAAIKPAPGPALSALKPTPGNSPPLETPTVPSAAAPAAEASHGDLLSELACAADERDAAQRRAEASDMALRRSFDAALKPAFDYLHQLTQHLNILKPVLVTPYTLGRDIVFAEPRWQHGTADYRTATTSEIALVQTVTLRASCMASTQLSFICAKEKATAWRNELSLINIRVLDESPAAQQDHVRFLLAPEILLQIHLAADLTTQQIILRTRNLSGFGLAAYTVPVADLTRSVLDEIGRCLLGRQRLMPAILTAVPFNYGLDRNPYR